jgi:flavin reductase (DIM6/NTAB) family NADH-FMN oxidoreductase RutF
MTAVSFDIQRFRQVLGHFTTGVAVITGLAAEGGPAGLAVGSFASVSLDPPLVAFMPDKNSSSWPRFRGSGSFCVNILGADQESVCRIFAQSGGDKFAGLSWRPAPSGSPIIDGVLAWVDCDIKSIHEEGDHYIVIGLVRALRLEDVALPLVFFRGGYGRFSAISIAVWEGDLSVQLRAADLARPEMEEVAEDLNVECLATAIVGDEVVFIARAGTLRSTAVPTDVGTRIPFEPPHGTLFVAWGPAVATRMWLDRAGEDVGPQTRRILERTLAAVRGEGYSVARGWSWELSPDIASTTGGTGRDGAPAESSARRSLHLLPADYESPHVNPEQVNGVSVPVFDGKGSVVLVLSATVAGHRSLSSEVARTVARLQLAGSSVSKRLFGSEDG